MSSRTTTLKTVTALKDADEDFEWYPSTDEIIDTVTKHLVDVAEGQYGRTHSIMDIGAGDGRVLKRFQERLKERAPHRDTVKLYAIEKAVTHQSNMPKDITIIGTEFYQQTLVDKQVDVIFCNPPYSEFTAWMLRIVRECCAGDVYLVVPERWRDSKEVRDALKTRAVTPKIIGQFDFENADRQARAKVEVLWLSFNRSRKDAFDSMLEEILPELEVFTREPAAETADAASRTDLREGNSNLVEVLVASYDKDLMSMIENYRAALKIPISVLGELGICKQGVLDSIRLKIKGMKNSYWKTLFDELGTVTSRLATSQRKRFLDSLQDKVTIDFTESNAYAILIWISKWANDYFDEQLIDLFRTLSNDSNTTKYKSNDRIWTECGWRYGKKYNFTGQGDNAATHYKLEYRMVVSHGGIKVSQWEFERANHRGLSENASNLLSDIVTVANNLGFPSSDSPRNYEWKSNKQNVLKFHNGKPLVAVRAFQNGNMHLHFDPKLMMAINVEAGRLLKWIRNPSEACEEMQIVSEAEKAQVASMFGSQFHISPDAGMLRLASKQAS